MMAKEERKVSISIILILSGLLWIGIAYGYVQSLFVYELCVFVPFIFVLIMFTKETATDKTIRGIVVYLTIISFINSIFRFDIASFIQVGLSIWLPVSISKLNIINSDKTKSYIIPCLLFLPFFAWEVTTRFDITFESNTFAFFGFMIFSIGYFWYILSKWKKICPIIYFTYTVSLIFLTQCRNAGIVYPFLFVLLLFNRVIIKKKNLMRCIYIVAFIYVFITPTVLNYVYENQTLRQLFLDYTTIFSEKSWGIGSRYGFYLAIQEKISFLPWYEKLFGQGIRLHHGHNLVYQSIYIYGYPGMVLVFVYYARILEMAIEMSCNNNDIVAFCCFLITIGNLLLNGADLYLIGTDCCAFLPQAIMGLIMYRYRIYKTGEMAQLVNWRTQ